MSTVPQRRTARKKQPLPIERKKNRKKQISLEHPVCGKIDICLFAV